MFRVALWVSFSDLFLCFLNNGHCMHQASRALAPAARATVPLWRPLPLVPSSSSTLFPSSSSRMISRPSALNLKPWSLFLPRPGPGWVASEVVHYEVRLGSPSQLFLPWGPPNTKALNWGTFSPCPQAILRNQPLPTTHEPSNRTGQLWVPRSAILAHQGLDGPPWDPGS